MSFNFVKYPTMTLELRAFAFIINRMVGVYDSVNFRAATEARRISKTHLLCIDPNMAGLHTLEDVAKKKKRELQVVDKSLNMSCITCRRAINLDSDVMRSSIEMGNLVSAIRQKMSYQRPNPITLDDISSQLFFQNGRYRSSHGPFTFPRWRPRPFT